MRIAGGGRRGQGSSLRVQGRRRRREPPIPLLWGSSLRVQGRPITLAIARSLDGVHPCGCRGGLLTAASSPSRHRGSSLRVQGRPTNGAWRRRRAMGSSLRVQGRRMTALGLRRFGGFIPAGAGAAAGRHRSTPPPGRVHPCGCRGGDELTAGTAALRRVHPCGCRGGSDGGGADRARGGVHPCGCRGGLRPEARSARRRGSSLRVQGRRCDPGSVDFRRDLTRGFHRELTRLDDGLRVRRSSSFSVSPLWVWRLWPSWS